MSIVNGTCIRTNETAAVYLMENGKRRWVPNPATYDNLFRNWDSIKDLPAVEVDGLPVGDPLSDGAILARAGSDHAIYLVSNGEKRHITGTETSPRNLDLNKTVSVKPEVMNLIETGTPM